MPEQMEPKADPTQLTTKQLLREIEHLRIELDTKMTGQFLAVAQNLELVERQRVEQKTDTKTAVDAALAAQKEAVREQTLASERAIAKSDAATTKQLEQLSATFSTAIAGVNQSVGDLKDRVTTIESVRKGGHDMVTATYALVGFLATITTIAGVLAAAGVFK